MRLLFALVVWTATPFILWGQLTSGSPDWGFMALAVVLSVGMAVGEGVRANRRAGR